MDLVNLAQSGSFRADLLQRLCVLRIHMPALRERTDDIPLLIAYFMRIHQDLPDVRGKVFTEAAVSTLMSYFWPGNVRELEAVVLRSALNAPGVNIHPNDAQEGLKVANGFFPGSGDTWIVENGLEGAVGEFEKGMISRQLKLAGGDIAKAAERLGIHRATVYKKMRKYGLT